jgi:hypothetical protein
MDARRGDVHVNNLTISSLLRIIAWACLGPFAAIGGLALLVFGFGALAICVRLLVALFGHAGV